MLIVNTVSAGVVRYFDDGRHPGRWSPGAQRLFGLTEPVDSRDLRRVLQGRDPVTDRYLPDVRPHRRRGGWDLIFGAPKSLSLLAATSERGAGVVDAHVAAVDGVLAYLEGNLSLARRGPDGRLLPAEGMVGAAFDHRTNAAGEPHLHTHVLVANLSRCGDSHPVWGAVLNGDWFVGRSGLAALYHLELRTQLNSRGWALAWRLRPDGLADLAEVPRSAVRATSTQSRMAMTAGRYAARAAAAPQPWADRAAEAGLPARIEDGERLEGVPRESLEHPDLQRKVGLRLTTRRSDFRKWDVVVALASCHEEGATVAQAMQWADRFCRLNHPVPSMTAGQRWTTSAARRVDDDLSAELRARTRIRPGEAGSFLPASDPADAVRALTAGDAGVHFLGASGGQSALLAQAEVIDACRQIWESQGRRAVISCPTADAAARWAVLTGLAAHRPGDRPDVLVVDRSDRRTSSELSRLAGGRTTTMIFVEGGTMPRLSNPASHGLMEVAEQVGRYMLPSPPDWGPAEGRMLADPPSASNVVGRDAAALLLGAWRRDGCGSVLVGLGVEETRALNRAAAAVQRQAVRGDAPVGNGFLPGDRVVVVKGRAGLPGYGTFGSVIGVEEGGRRGRASLTIGWDHGETTTTADRYTLGGIRLGYAVTPHLAGRTKAPLMVLGPAHSLGRGRERVVLEAGIPLEAGVRRGPPPQERGRWR